MKVLCLKLVLLVKNQLLMSNFGNVTLSHSAQMNGVSLWCITPHKNGTNSCIFCNPHRKQQFKSFSNYIWISREVWWMPFDVKHGWVSLSAKSLLRHAMTQLRITGKISTLLEKPARFPLLTACQSKVIDTAWQMLLDWGVGWIKSSYDGPICLCLFSCFDSVFFFSNREWFEKADASFETQHRLLGC